MSTSIPSAGLPTDRPPRFTRFSRLSTLRRFARRGALVAAFALPLALSAAPAPAAAAGPEPAAPPAGAYTLPFATLQGKPDLNAAGDFGYWLWHDEDGLHLRTTTRGRPHLFSGVIRSRERNEFFDVHRVRQEHTVVNDDRTVVADNDAIRFRFVTYDGMDGIDFRLSGGAFCVQLADDGREATGATHLGAAETAPQQLPVCFQRDGQGAAPEPAAGPPPR